jgi:RNA recognition motif-containing protein
MNEPSMGTRLYIGNLSYETTEDDLRAALSEGGRNVKEIHIVTDRETGRPRGFAFAEMANEADAQSAIESLEGASLGGRNLTVNEARERSPRPGGGGGGGGSGGGGGGGGYGGGGGGRSGGGGGGRRGGGGGGGGGGRDRW